MPNTRVTMSAPAWAESRIEAAIASARDGVSPQRLAAYDSAMRLGAKVLNVWGIGGKRGYIVIECSPDLSFTTVPLDDAQGLGLVARWLLGEVLPCVTNVSNVAGCHDGWHKQKRTGVHADSAALDVLRKYI